MKEKIINRVKSSPLILIDLEEFYPKNKMMVFDISLWLDQGFVLREKEFREKAKNFTSQTNRSWHEWETKRINSNYGYQ